jgi:hypothetical protein
MTGTAIDAMTERASPDSLTPNEIGLVLDYLLSHKQAFLQDFLRKHSLPFSGTKQRLRERVEAHLAEDRLAASDLVQVLNRIEGWGNQHIYLYKAPDRAIEPWLTESSVRSRLYGLGLAGLFGRPRPLVLPDERTLSSIEWASERVRFVWVEKQQWEERVAGQDIEQDGMVWRAYRLNVSRGLIAFDWDLVSGYAMLMIRRLPHGTRYDAIKKELESVLEPLVSLSQFERLRVSRAIPDIQRSSEVRRRHISYRTIRGGEASLTSAGRSRDALADPALKRADSALEGDTTGLLGDFYWLPAQGGLKSELHSRLYAQDQRVGIFGEHQEKDVRHVISRIRHYCG